MTQPTAQDVRELAQRARAASFRLAKLTDDVRTSALLAAADSLVEHTAEIVRANHRDCAAAALAVEQGKMTQAMYKRLQTSEQGVALMAGQVRQVASLPDPLGRTLARTALDDDLVLSKVSCPLGVVAVIFESRPDVTPQVASLALKSGNALLLKGGSEAEHTNRSIVGIWRDAVSKFPGIAGDFLVQLETREDISQLLSLSHEVDLIIPRGSNEFVQYIAKHSSVPVLGHGEGVCHVYVDRAADLGKATEICLDAKTQYPAACNAAETFLIHRDVASLFLPMIVEKLHSAGVEVRGCPLTVELNAGIVPATESDWKTEYSDLIVSIKIVASLTEAIEHINRFGSRHTEAIVTEDAMTAEEFMDSVDAAGVYHNVSTRFADGYRYGFGAELGISTGKLHARGPMGLNELTTYKYKLHGNGQTVASYLTGERTFKHRAL